MLSKGQRATQRAALKAPRSISTNSGSAWCRVQGAPARERCDACCLCDLRERAHAPLGTTSEPTESGCAAEGLRADAQGEREETVGSEGDLIGITHAFFATQEQPYDVLRRKFETQRCSRSS